MNTIGKPFVTDLVEEVGSLPSAAAAIVGMTADPACDLEQLARAIGADAAMTLRFLALANSAAISRGQQVRDVKSALVRLGMRRVRNVALLMGVHDMMPAAEVDVGLEHGEFWNFSLATASCAQGLAWQRGAPALEDAWLVGLLHGIGVAALARQAAPGLAAAVARARSDRTNLCAAEMRVLDFHHGELGGRMLTHWRLPAEICLAVEFHPEEFAADEIPAEAAQLVAVLHDARRIVRAAGYGDSGDGDPPPALADAAAAAGLSDAALEALAGKIDCELQDMASCLDLRAGDQSFQAALDDARGRMARLGLEGMDQAIVRESLEQQLAVARQIQQRLLPPTMPAIPPWELAASNLPSAHVSGDIYDVVPMTGDRTCLVLADVAGKGLPAALLATSLQATVRALATVISDPARLMAAVNEALFAGTDDEHFATLFLAVLHPDGSGFRYASAGHTPPLLLRRGGDAEWLRPAGTPVGLLPGAEYPVREINLAPGDLLVAVTDGVTEALDDGGREFGNAGLEEAVRAAAGMAAPALAAHVLAAVAGHGRGLRASLRPDGGAGTEPPQDDLTMLVLRRRA